MEEELENKDHETNSPHLGKKYTTIWRPNKVKKSSYFKNKK